MAFNCIFHICFRTKTSKNKRTASAVVIKPAAEFKEHQESNCPVCSWTRWTSPRKKRQAEEAICNVVNAPKSPKLVAENEFNETSEFTVNFYTESKSKHN